MTMLDGYVAIDGGLRYCGPFKRVWASLLPHEPRVVVDCGAFDGGDSMRFARWWPKAKIVTIEPHPRLAMELRDEGIFDLHEIALSDQDGVRDFYFGDMILGIAGPSGSFYRVCDASIEVHAKDRVYAREPISVKVHRLDTFCASAGIGHIDIIQIDAEAAEYEVCLGFGPLRPSIVMCEMSIFTAMRDCPHTKEDLYDLMADYGYCILEEDGNDTVWIHRGANAV